jgi:DNA-binding NarL/FixJ family response regulator
MDSKLKVFIVDDHDMFRQGVKVLLGKSQKTEIIGEASNGKEFLDVIRDIEPDVVLMDISMPVLDGIEATRQALQIKPDLKILTLSMFGDEEYYYKMIQSGVKGFIMKSAGIDELEYSINQVAEGSAYFSEELLEIVKTNVNTDSEQYDQQTLSKTEMELLKLFTSSLSDADIIREMGITTEDFEKLRKNLLKKTGTVNSAGLIMYAIKNGIVGF